MQVAIIGAGVCGLSCATELVQRGVVPVIYERGSRIGAAACSWFAGGMLAPWCERENADEAVLVHGQQALSWWRQHTDGVVDAGSLVVAPPRDIAELRRFAVRTRGFERIDGERIAALEPELADRFQRGLYFPDEAHLNPRRAIQQLAERLQQQGVSIHFDTEVAPDAVDGDVVLDCRGYAARPDWDALRGVKGEMLILRAPELQLNRPVRLLHPRIPLYVVPREEGHFMVGATMIENAERDRLSARSLLELLGSAYALHPGFGEAEVVEIGVDVRPAFADNLPRLRRQGRVLQVNGLYRHGFLLSPAMAVRAAQAALDPASTPEVLQ